MPPKRRSVRTAARKEANENKIEGKRAPEEHGEVKGDRRRGESPSPPPPPPVEDEEKKEAEEEDEGPRIGGPDATMRWEGDRGELVLEEGNLPIVKVAGLAVLAWPAPHVPAREDENGNLIPRTMEERWAMQCPYHPEIVDDMEASGEYAPGVIRRYRKYWLNTIHHVNDVYYGDKDYIRGSIVYGMWYRDFVNPFGYRALASPSAGLRIGQGIARSQADSEGGGGAVAAPGVVRGRGRGRGIRGGGGRGRGRGRGVARGSPESAHGSGEQAGDDASVGDRSGHGSPPSPPVRSPPREAHRRPLGSLRPWPIPLELQ